MAPELNIRGRLLKHLEASKHDISNLNVTLICSNGKFKVNPMLVVGIYYLFEQIYDKLEDEGPASAVLNFPDIETEDLEISFLCLYQQNFEEPICRRWLNIVERNVKLKSVAWNGKGKLEEMTDFHDDIHEDGENNVLVEDPVTIGFVKKPNCTKGRLEKQRVPCQLCGKQVKKQNLKGHLDFVHKQDPDKILAQKTKLPCEKCGKEVSLQSMRKHLKRHADALKAKDTCSICGKPQRNLKQHMALVHGIGELQDAIFCDVCGKAFTSNATLKSHLATHEAKKPCTVCGAVVKQMYHHMKQAHTPNDEKKHKCPECGKGFYQTTKLAQHRINVHLRNKPFPCRYGCDIRYNDSSSRNSHERKKHGGLFNKQAVPPESVTQTD